VQWYGSGSGSEEELVEHTGQRWVYTRNKSSSVWGMIQTCGDIGYKQVAPERVHNTKHKSWGMGEGIRGSEGGQDQDQD